ncbi:MAG: branched-chain amino acid ABC transporter permease [Thermoanaerobaculia bacterium]|nr:branched-chain amino acid ABC transporter permease [Thermoanaerobaculia bacterium]
MDYLLHIVTLVGIFTALAVSFELLAGQAGLLSLSHAALYGVGAYGTALALTRGGLPAFGGLLVGIACAVIAAVPIGVAGLRLRGDRFVLATLAFQVLATSVFENWIGLTGGTLGISGVGRGGAGAWHSGVSGFFPLVAGAVAAIAIVLRTVLSTGPFGRVLHCLRDDEAIALSLGKSVQRVKFQVLAVSGGVAGAAGGVFALYTTYVDPYSFTLNESIAVATMAIVGGLRTTWGPVLGATALIFLPELLRFSGLPQSIAAPMNQVFFGAALVWVVVARPQGLLGPAGGSFAGDRAGSRSA